MRHIGRSAVALAIFGLGRVVGACGSVGNELDCATETTLCGADVDGGSGAEGGVITPPGCDLAKSPKDSPACVSDGVGIFVSPTGSDGATGGKSTPVKSIAKGVELAAARGLPRVYVCEGTYADNAEVKTGLSVFGGFSCAWDYTGARPKLAPSKGIALRVTKVTAPVIVEEFDVVGSADASVPGDSAIAAFVSESGNVTFRSVNLTAGSGTPGAKVGTATNWSGTAAAGNGTTTAAGALEKPCACIDGKSSKGGRGGTVNGLVPASGLADPIVGAANGGLNGDDTCETGTAGANGVSGAPQASGPGSSGELNADGWKLTVRGAAASGNPGQGGGGGGSRATIDIGGGGGGCGGCGGAGGSHGGGGGASFALLSFNSNVDLAAGALTTAAGGLGGEGGAGQDGQSGGARGTGACNGGAGGAGAGGSGGSGGSGGHSVPIGFTGPEPRVNGTTLTPGAVGKGGAAGAAGQGAGNPGQPGAAGPDGKAQPTLAL